jgi:hypothetical protein
VPVSRGYAFMVFMVAGVPADLKTVPGIDVPHRSGPEI